MNRRLGVAAFALGLAAVAWVGYGYLGSNPLALTMTALVAAFYVMGALELHRFQQATASLQAALAAVPAGLANLGDWLSRVHPSLHNPVRLRIEGERVGLPGPAMTPYLVGLLVLLGMLGTFLGMVVTLNGAVMALESTTDPATIRAALAAPVKGLGLAFGTSVAGVAASAMLGLMSALCRRERLQAAQQLDSGIATVLRRFSLAHQREETLKALQQQAGALPAVAQSLQAWMLQMERQSQALQAQLLSSQDRFHQHAQGSQDRFHQQAQGSYSELAAAVDRSLQRSLTESVRAAGAAVQPVVEATMAGITRESAALRADMSQAAQQQLEAWAAALQQSSADAARAAAAVTDELRVKLSDSLVRDNAMLDERSRILATVDTLLGVVQQGAAEQRGAIDALVGSAAAMLQDAGTRFHARVDADAERLAAVATQVTGSAAAVASLGTDFSQGLAAFGASNDALVANLQRMEATMKKSMLRSDEQLAYYVAQAREIVDLSILSQRQILEDMQRMAEQNGAGKNGAEKSGAHQTAASKPAATPPAPRAHEVG